MNLCDIREVRSLLGRHGFRFSKSMGQNFLIEDWVPREIAAASGADSACGVLEIGPGIGCLTRELCALAGKVVSVELDRALLPVLAESMAGAENFTLLPGDALKLDLAALAEEHPYLGGPAVAADTPVCLHFAGGSPGPGPGTRLTPWHEKQRPGIPFFQRGGGRDAVLLYR